MRTARWCCAPRHRRRACAVSVPRPAAGGGGISGGADGPAGTRRLLGEVRELRGRRCRRRYGRAAADNSVRRTPRSSATRRARPPRSGRRRRCPRSSRTSCSSAPSSCYADSVVSARVVEGRVLGLPRRGPPGWRTTPRCIRRANPTISSRTRRPFPRRSDGRMRVVNAMLSASKAPSEAKLDGVPRTRTGGDGLARPRLFEAGR